MKTHDGTTVASRTLLFTKIIAAIAQYITAAVVLGGKSLTPQALAAMFQAYLQAESDLEVGRLDVAARERTRDAAYAALVDLMPSLRSYLAATYGEKSAAYAAFGFVAKKVAVRSAAVVAAAVVKGRATRAAHEAAKVAPVPAPVPAPTPAKS